MPRYSELSLRPSSGGRLVTVTSDELPDLTNYTVKTNLRRMNDEEVRREGTVSAASNAPANILGTWEVVRANGERVIVCATATNIYKLSAGSWSSIGSGYSASWWQAESLNGYIIFNNSVDLPCTWEVQDAAVTPMHELREIGIARVGTMAVYNGFLLFGDVTTIAAESLAAVMNGGSPYGVVADNICNRIRYRITWCDYANPRNWAPVIPGTIQSASRNQVTLAWPSQCFKVGDKLAVAGAGPAGGVLGGQVATPDGVPITAIDGATLTLGASADVDLTYPLAVTVTRFADTSSFVGHADITDDSSTITRLKTLKQVLVVYRETGIFTGRYTAEYEMPFLFTPAYRGPDVPAYPMCVGEVEGDYHVYPTNNRFVMFDNAGNPRIHRTIDDARSLFFSAPGNRPFAENNPLTKEIWFGASNGVLAFDYQFNTCSWIDESYGSALYANGVFYMSKGAALYSQSATWTRASGASNIPELVSGYGALNDDFNQKELRNYGLLIGSSSPTQSVEVTLRGKDNITESVDTWLVTTLMSPLIAPYLETHYRSLYFQDRIRVPAPANSQLRITGRVFRFTKRDTRGVTRHGNP